MTPEQVRLTTKSKPATNLTPAEIAKALRALTCDLWRCEIRTLLRAAADLIDQMARHACIADAALETKERLNQTLRGQVDRLKKQLADLHRDKRYREAQDAAWKRRPRPGQTGREVFGR